MPYFGSKWNGEGLPGIGNGMASVVMGQQIRQKNLAQLAYQQALLNAREQAQREKSVMDQKSQALEEKKFETEKPYKEALTKQAGAQTIRDEASTKETESKTSTEDYQRGLAQQFQRTRGTQLSPQGPQVVSKDPQFWLDAMQSGAMPQSGGDVPVEQIPAMIKAMLAAQSGGQAMMSPSSAERLQAPVSMNPGESLRNPFDPGEVLATQAPAQMTPLQQSQIDLNKERTDAVKSGQDIKAINVNKNIAALMMNPVIAVHPELKEQLQELYKKNAEMYSSEEGDKTNPTVDDIPTYSSEEEARSAGAKNGDRIRIKGVGVGKLK